MKTAVMKPGLAKALTPLWLTCKRALETRLTL